MTTRIYIARHGETLWNIQNRMQGQKDSPLTEKGKQQALMLRENLKDNPGISGYGGICTAYCSALGRAVETLNICMKGSNIPSCRYHALNEICLGPWEGLTFDEVDRQWPEQFNNFWHHPSCYIPSGMGETFMEVQTRMVNAINRIRHTHTGGDVLIISHWIAIKTALAHFQDMEIDSIPRMPKPGNGTCQIIEFEDGNIRVKIPKHERE
jgi:probable phosphoglycerate mutase